MTTKVKLLHDTVGIPTGAVAVTQSASDNTTKVATTAYVTTALANLADSAPSTLNTLNELAAALGDDANFSTTVTNSIATKLPLAGGTLTGDLTTNGDIIVDNSSGDPFLKLKTSAQEYVIRIDQSDSEKFQIRDTTNSATRMTIDTSGNVGIGTNNPTSFLSNATALEISGGTGVGSELILTNNSSMSANEVVGSLIFKNTDGSGSPNHFAGLRAKAEATYGRMYLEFYAGRSRMEGNTPDMVISPGGADAQAKVAIGSTTDALANMSGLFRILDSTGGDRTVAHFGAHNYGDTGKTFINIGSEYGDGTSRIGSFNDTGNSSVLVFDTHSATSGQFTERMRISSNGSIGVGTTDSTYSMSLQNIVSNDVLLQIKNTTANEDTGIFIDAVQGGAATNTRIGHSVIAGNNLLQITKQNKRNDKLRNRKSKFLCTI